MHRGFLIVFVPAAVVGALYIAAFRAFGLEIGLAPFLGTAAAFLGGLAGVWQYQRRKRGGRRN
jgi:hypothetical protein